MNFDVTNYQWIYASFEVEYLESIKDKHLKWIWKNNKEEKKKHMSFLVSSLRPSPFKLIEQIDKNLIDLNCVNLSKKTKLYSALNPIIENFLYEYYSPSKMVEKFINLNSHFGINQLAFIDLFKFYMFHVFSEKKRQKIMYSEDSYLFYDEVLYFSYKYTQRDKNGFSIDETAKQYLSDGKTIFLTPKQTNFKFFDYLILNSNFCYFIGIKNRIRKNLHFILGSGTFDENNITKTLQSYRNSINNIMERSEIIKASGLL